MRTAAAAICLAGSAGGAAAQDPAGAVLRPRTAAEDLQLFSQVLNQIRVNHPDTVDTHTLFMAAVEGMIRAADPHSYVIPAQRLSPEKERELRAGRLHPVPVSFSFIGGSPVVVSVAPGSAAARLDILPGDLLVAIDGDAVTAESPDELEIVLAGPKGSGVTLTLERRRLDGSLARVERHVTRERVEEASAVPAAFLLDPQTGYVRITTFVGEKVAEDTERALRALEAAGMRRVVIDLRDNGGGSVAEAARIAGAFLPAGSVVYTAEGRKPQISDVGRVKRAFWRSEKAYPVALLINGGTASASELVAGALQDHDRAIVVGHPSFGKALLMQAFPLSDGSVMWLVVGHLRTPCGRIIQRQYRGITARDYFRLGREARDRAGRETCRTDAGRTVYGGGGIYPDVVLPEVEPDPLWLARARELELPVQWAGAYAGSGALPDSPETFASSPSLPAAALADFRALAEKAGVRVPESADADRVLARSLARTVAGVKWGAAGYYRVAAVLDPEVEAARRELGKE
ncbi:MAG TPA: S41 family peptidase [Longimicrobiales bacterium]|nr:S41 family peptidase [Longimicrobiales bacterium]